MAHRQSDEELQLILLNSNGPEFGALPCASWCKSKLIGEGL